jgi:ABC-type transport system involved in multi-copper enzyme maturation permease subunit
VRAQLHSELLKIRTIRTVAVFLLAAVALTLLGVLVEGFSAGLGDLATENTQRTLLGDYGASNAVLLSTFVGLLLVTSEFRYGTIRPTLLLEPRRRVFLAAKLAAAALTGIVFAIVCVALSFGAGLAVLAARDVDVALTGTHTLVLVVGPVAASALTAMMGVTIGALVRNQVGAIVVLAVYSLAIEALLFAAVPSVGRYLPGQASSALGGMPDEDLLAPGIAAAVVVAWTLVFVAAAAMRTDHSDV